MLTTTYRAFMMEEARVCGQQEFGRMAILGHFIRGVSRAMNVALDNSSTRSTPPVQVA
jgi:hypothetical protein